MKTTLFVINGTQAVHLPEGFCLPGREVSIRRLGDGILIEPVLETAWPEGFFEGLRIEDEAFGRPEQGAVQSRTRP